MDNLYSRYVLGGITDVYTNRLGYWSLVPIRRNQPDDIFFTIDLKTQFRPDLISYKYYNQTSFEWLVLQYNFIVDINEEFIVGNQFSIPSYDRLFSNIITKTQKPNVITK
jgi:hypothetical protein